MQSTFWKLSSWKLHVCQCQVYVESSPSLSVPWRCKPNVNPQVVRASYSGSYCVASHLNNCPLVCWYWCLVSATEPFCHINKEYVGSINSTEAGLCSVMQPAVMVCIWIGRMRGKKLERLNGRSMNCSWWHIWPWNVKQIMPLTNAMYRLVRSKGGFSALLHWSEWELYVLVVGQETKDHGHPGASVRLTPWCCHALAPDNRHLF